MGDNSSPSQISIPMAESTQPVGPPAARYTGPLSVRGDGPSHDLNFLVGQQSKRLLPAFLTSFLLDAGIVLKDAQLQLTDFAVLHTGALETGRPASLDGPMEVVTG